MSLRLPHDTVARLKARGAALNVGYQTVLKRLLHDALDATPEPKPVVREETPEEAPEEAPRVIPADTVISDDDIDEIFDGVGDEHEG